MNGLPQGGILTLTLFNIYTNDQPEKTRHFLFILMALPLSLHISPESLKL